MEVPLPNEITRGAAVVASNSVGVQEYDGGKPVVLDGFSKSQFGAKVESIVVLIASGAAGIPTQDAVAGLLAMQERSQDGPDKDVVALRQALQGMGVNPPVNAKDVGLNSTPAMPKVPVREV